MSYANLERPYRRLTDTELSRAYVEGPPDPSMTWTEHYRALALEALIRFDTLKSKETAPCPTPT